MVIKYYVPALSLRPYIKLYTYYNIEEEKISGPIKFLPMGSPYVVFNLKDSFSIYNSNLNMGLFRNGNLIVGQQESFYYLKPNGKLITLCVIFQPAGLYRLLHVPVHELINYAYPAENFLKNKLIPLYDKILSINQDPSEIVYYLDDFFIAELAITNYRYEYIEHILDSIYNTKGLIPLRLLVEQANISGRTFRRRFLESVGISCKSYMCLRRMSHILNAVKHQQPLDINWSKIACSSGYYDQMHFIKAFRKFCGENPTGYITRYHNPEHVIERYFLSASE